MSDLFIKRMNNKGSYVGEVVKKQSDTIMNATFLNDAHTKPVHVYYHSKKIDAHTYAKFQQNSAFSILKDQVDYHLQFRTQEHYPIGCYVDMPDDQGITRTWLIVGRDDNPQFVKYSILQCNWTFKWIVKNKIHTCLGCLRNRNSYNSGIWNDGWLTTVENQIAFWVPFNNDTQTLNYDIRFLISENQINPLSYCVTKITDVQPSGIVKVVLKQDQFNTHRDNAELMIADYYKDSITTENSEPSDLQETGLVAKIDISSWKVAKIAIGSTSNVLLGYFHTNNTIVDMEGFWSYEIPNHLINMFTINAQTNPNQMTIGCKKDYSLVGQVIKIRFHDASGLYVATQEIEVTAR